MFKQFFDKVVSSDLLRLDAGPEEGRGPYYRKPTLYMANSMALSGYDEWDVEAGIQKLLEAKKKKKKKRKVDRYCNQGYWLCTVNRHYTVVGPGYLHKTIAQATSFV